MTDDRYRVYSFIHSFILFEDTNDMFPSNDVNINSRSNDERKNGKKKRWNIIGFHSIGTEKNRIWNNDKNLCIDNIMMRWKKNWMNEWMVRTFCKGKNIYVNNPWTPTKKDVYIFSHFPISSSLFFRFSIDRQWFVLLIGYSLSLFKYRRLVFFRFFCLAKSFVGISLFWIKDNINAVKNRKK